MSVSHISSNNPYLSMTPPLSQPKQDLSSLATALNAGDVNGAQTALTAFQQDLQQFQSATPGSGLPANLTNDLQQIQSALSSNNLTDAKADFDAFLKDLQQSGVQKHHGHHHHSHAYSSQSLNPSTAGGVGGPTGTAINLTV